MQCFGKHQSGAAKSLYTCRVNLPILGAMVLGLKPVKSLTK